ncbi:MAG: hypothetical protein U0570_09545 [Phycisphaerales bacterium]
MRIAVALCALVTGSAAHAAGDISLQISAGQLMTTKISEDGQPLGPDRVFSGMFSSVSGTWYTDEPGIQIEPGTLAPVSTLQFFFTRALRQWNGSSFELVSGPRVGATFGPPTNSILTPVTDTDSPNLLFPVESNGGLHDHPDWVLEGFDPGVNPFYFLVEARFSTTQPGLEATSPFYIVFGVNGDEAELDALEQYVRDQVIPSPAGPLAMAGLTWMIRRRR